MALYLIVPGLVTAPADAARVQPGRTDHELSVDIDLDEIETTIRISLDESRRLVDEAFANPD